MKEIYLGKEKVYKITFIMALFMSVTPYILNVVPSVQIMVFKMTKPFFWVAVFIFVLNKVYKQAVAVFWLFFCIFMNIITYYNSGVKDDETVTRIFVITVIFCAFMCQYDRIFFVKCLTYYFTALIVLNTLLWRPGGTFINSNGQLSFVVGTKTSITYYQIAACLFAYINLKIEANKIKGALICGLIILSVGIYDIVQPISTSKVCLFTFVFLVLLDMWKPKLSRLVLKCSFSIALVLNVLIVIFRIQYRFEYLLVDVLHEDLTLDYRTFIWDEVLFWIADKPIWGYGTKSGITFINNYNTSAHNQLLSWTFQYGVVGLVIMLIFAYCIIRKYSIYDIRGRIIRITYTTLAAMWFSEQWMSYTIYIIMTILLANLHEYKITDNINCFQNATNRRINE